jgi:hypothetical protein
MKSLAVAASILMTLPSVSLAGWQGAEWGMSSNSVWTKVQIELDEVPAARQSAEATPGNLAKFRGVYTAGELQFSTILQFDRQDKLNAVRLKLMDFQRCESLKTALLSRYGAPTQTRHSRTGFTLSWIDASNHNNVDLDAAPSIASCTVIYTPLDGNAVKKL